jgi:hypothetical protein
VLIPKHAPNGDPVYVQDFKCRCHYLNEP